MNWTLGMPNLGHKMDEGRVQAWLKAVGDPVRAGEAVVIVESDKASFEVESPADGVLLAIHAEAGSLVPVGAAIGLVGNAEAAPAPVPVPTPPAALRSRVAPAARALAHTLGVDAEQLAGTGEGGLITREDVRAAAAAAVTGTAASAAATPGATLPAASAAVAPAPAVQPLTPMRRTIAEATQRAWQTIPAVPLHRPCRHRCAARCRPAADGGRSPRLCADAERTRQLQRLAARRWFRSRCRCRTGRGRGHTGRPGYCGAARGTNAGRESA